MKCAIELLAIAKEAETLRAIEEQARIERARLEALARRKRTIEWCEEVLAPYLENQAMESKSFAAGEWSWYLNSDHTMHFDAYNADRKLIRPLKYNTRYANGEKSYAPYGDYIDVDVIAEYCKQFCIEVMVTNRNYKQYGHGFQWGAELHFRIAPECLENK